jgi:Leucine carboxyl methyltransferase
MTANKHVERFSTTQQLDSWCAYRGWHMELKKCGWRVDEPTVWLAEGLLMYLEQEASEQLLQTLAGGRLCCSGDVGCMLSFGLVISYTAQCCLLVGA